MRRQNIGEKMLVGEQPEGLGEGGRKPVEVLQLLLFFSEIGTKVICQGWRSRRSAVDVRREEMMWNGHLSKWKNNWTREIKYSCLAAFRASLRFIDGTAYMMRPFRMTCLSPGLLCCTGAAAKWAGSGSWIWTRLWCVRQGWRRDRGGSWEDSQRTDYNDQLCCSIWYRRGVRTLREQGPVKE